MGRIRRKFDADFKRKVVEEVESGAISGSAACRKYEISYGVLQSWKDKLQAGELVDRPSKREKALESENEKLKAKIGELVMQNDLLKKFPDWIQQRRKLNTSVITSKNLDQFRKGAK